MPQQQSLPAGAAQLAADQVAAVVRTQPWGVLRWLAGAALLLVTGTATVVSGATWRRVDQVEASIAVERDRNDYDREMFTYLGWQVYLLRCPAPPCAGIEPPPPPPKKKGE